MKFLQVLFLILVGLVPSLAFAENGLLEPIGDANTWDMYVYGNARVIYDILNGVKLLMVPTAGNTGFMTLLLLLATLGFLVLAIAAGFDPGKNLVRMFTYILVVWAVTFGTTRLTANISIQDLARDPSGNTPVYIVDRAPALVVLPAALTSEVGFYFTRVIETYFTVPQTFKMSQSTSGQFNLFGKLIAESSQYGFATPELKRSLSAYVSDCVVPAMATGRLSGPTAGGTKFGASAILETTDMMAALETASHKSILTKYYPIPGSGDGWMATINFDSNGMELSQGSSVRSTVTGFGALATCEDAYKQIKIDMTQEAEALLGKGNQAWAKAGILVPFETAMSDMLATVAAPGNATNMSRPSGFILQQALLNTSNGSFRQAAVQTGNNELMTAVALSQAEQQQKSAWSAGFAVFNNMMGYVYVVLQSFIFAITPMVVIALMIPGLGKSIFTNYAQILVWLTLWQPMLSIINFIITLFGADSVAGAMSMSGGVALNNKGLINEKTSDLMVAAQFLGTMTPLLTWGLVKGAMAFTEFISSGVGSSMASSAGMSAATGNLSMNNMSMDNTSMNKFNTAMSSTIGTQETVAFGNAGAGLMTQQGGGSNATVAGKGVDVAQSMQKQTQEMASQQKQVSEALTTMMGQNLSMGKLQSMARGEGVNSVERQAAQMVLARVESMNRGNGAGEVETNTTRAGDTTSAGGTVSNNLGQKVDAKVGVGLKGGVGVVSGGGSVGYTADTGTDVSNSGGRSFAKGAETGATASLEQDRLTTGKGSSAQKSVTTGNEVARTGSEDRRNSDDKSVQIQKAVADAKSQSEALTKGFQAMQAVTQSVGISSDVTLADVQNLRNQMEQMGRGQMSLEQINEKFTDMAGRVTGNAEAVRQEWNKMRDEAVTEFNGMRPMSRAPQGTQQFTQDVRNDLKAADKELDTRKAEFRKKGEEIRTTVDNGQRTYTPQGIAPVANMPVNPNTGKSAVAPVSDKLKSASRFIPGSN